MKRITFLILASLVAFFGTVFSTSKGKIHWMSEAEAGGRMKDGGDPCGGHTC
jgi:hypothetical protein